MIENAQNREKELQDIIKKSREEKQRLSELIAIKSAKLSKQTKTTAISNALLIFVIPLAIFFINISNLNTTVYIMSAVPFVIGLCIGIFLKSKINKLQKEISAHQAAVEKCNRTIQNAQETLMREKLN